MASAPPRPLSPTSLTCVPASGSQITSDAAQITGSKVASACAVVAIAAGAQLSEEFIHGGTSSTKVMQQHMKSESEELTAKMKEKNGVHEQATSS